MRKVLLSSGGMDSWLLAHELQGQDVAHVFIDIGQKYIQKELKASIGLAVELGAKFEAVQGPDLAQYEHSTGIIPFRNAQMIMLAAIYGEAIYFGVIADEINSDKSVEFCEAMESVLNISHRPQYWTDGKRFEIRTPYRHQTKSELVRKFLDNGGSLDKLLTSVSCYDAGEHHCGQCPSCFKRWVALVNACTVDNWQQWGFVRHPAAWKPLAEWQNKMKDYSVARAHEITSAFAIAGVIA